MLIHRHYFERCSMFIVHIQICRFWIEFNEWTCSVDNSMGNGGYSLTEKITILCGNEKYEKNMNSILSLFGVRTSDWSTYIVHRFKDSHFNVNYSNEIHYTILNSYNHRVKTSFIRIIVYIRSIFRQWLSLSISIH